MKKLLGFFAAALLGIVLAAEECNPELQKLLVDGKPFYAKGAPVQELDLGVLKGPAKMEFHIVNRGTKPTGEPYKLFVHFCDESGKSLDGADFAPKIETTQWTPGQEIVLERSVPQHLLKDKVTVRIGLWEPKSGARILFCNEGDNKDGLLLGTLQGRELRPTVLLRKVEINGELLFQEGVPAKTVKINGDWPAKINCTFVNTGDAVEGKYRIFIHFIVDDKIIENADFLPQPPVAEWKTNQEVEIQTQKKFGNTGKTCSVYLGLYLPTGHLKLANQKSDRPFRIPLGTVVIEE